MAEVNPKAYPLAGRHKRATCPLSAEGAQGRPIGLGIGVLQPQKIETLLKNGTH